MAETSDQPFPAPSSRVNDRDRELAIARLKQAAVDDRLDISELEERIDSVYAARTRSELEALTVDLPAVKTPDVPALQLKTKAGSVRRDGYWIVPSKISVRCHSGSIKLNFTEAECAHREVEIDVSVKSGSAVFIVPHGWSVNLDNASASSGSVRNKVRERPLPGAPVLRIRGEVTSGTIKARYPFRSFKEWLADTLSKFISE